MTARRMEVLPAIDLLGHEAVRLQQGDYERVSGFGAPEELASRFAAEGARWIHVVDLDGARACRSSQPAASAARPTSTPSKPPALKARSSAAPSSRAGSPSACADYRHKSGTLSTAVSDTRTRPRGSRAATPSAGPLSLVTRV